METFEKPKQGPKWVKPNFARERGEVERVVREFLRQEATTENINTLTKTLEAAPVVELSDTDWRALQNTDSFHNVAAGDIASAEKITEGYNLALVPHLKRNFQDLLAKMQGGADMDMPVVVRKDGIMHLVSGNTRLMISRALSYRPKIVLADLP